MAGPISWIPPSGPPVKWSPPDDSLAGISGSFDETGRAVVAAPTSPRAGSSGPNFGALSAQQQMDMIPEEELQGNLAAADAALAPRGPLGPDEILAGQAGGLTEAYADLEARRLAMRPRTVAKANPKAPIVQRRFFQRGDPNPDEREAIYEQQNPFQPSPYLPLPRDPDESDEEYTARNQTFEEFHIASERDDYDRRKAADIEAAQTVTDPRDIGQGIAPGMEEALRQGTEQEHAAMVQQSQDVAREEAIAAQKQADATTEMARATFAQREHEQAAQEAVQQIRGVSDQARKNLAAMPEINRQRVAKGLSTGTKIAALLGAIGQGWRGDAVTAVNDAIDKGVAEEMDKYIRRQGEYQDTVAQADDAMSFLDFTVNSLGGSVRAGESMLRAAKIEDAIAELKAKESAAATPVIAAQLANVRVGLEQRLRDETDALELEAVTTPNMIIKTYDPQRHERRLIEEQQKEYRGEIRDVRKDFRGLPQDDLKHARALELEGVKGEAAAGKERSGEATKLAHQHSKDVAKMQAASQIMRGFVKRARAGDVAGRGMDAYFATEEGRQVRETVKEGLRRQLRYESQGVIGEDEIEDRVDSMESGWGDNEYLQNAERLINANDMEVEEREYGLPEEARQIYYRDPNLAPLPARSANRPSGGVEEDAAALGGKVVR